MRSPIDEIIRKKLTCGREEIDQEEHIFLKYRISPAFGLSHEEAAARVLAITTLRTMNCLYYEDREQQLELAGRLLYNNRGDIEIALPLSYCSEREGLTHLMLMITAASEYNYTETFWIESIELPRKFINRFIGPHFGIEGIRKIFNIETRPIIGLVLKPRQGVSIEKIGEIAGRALDGGVDFLLDDLLLIDPDGELQFENRVRYFTELVEKSSNAHKRKKGYFVNIGLSPYMAIEYAERAIEVGATALMVDTFTMGLGGVDYINGKIGGRVPIIATNMGSGIMTRGTWLGDRDILPTGMSEAVIAKLSRIAGADAVHTGTSASECYGEDAWGPASRALGQGLYNIRKSMAVVEGDLNVANLWQNIMSLGQDILVEATSGIVNYPGGPENGAKAFLLLAENLSQEMGPKEAEKCIKTLAKNCKFLENGLRAFNYEPQN